MPADVILAAGSGSAMPSHFLRSSGLRPRQLVLSNVVNAATLAQLRAGVPPRETTLGRMVERGVSGMGWRTGAYTLRQRGDAVDIVVDLP